MKLHWFSRRVSNVGRMARKAVRTTVRRGANSVRRIGSAARNAVRTTVRRGANSVRRIGTATRKVLRLRRGRRQH